MYLIVPLNVLLLNFSLQLHFDSLILVFFFLLLGPFFSNFSTSYWKSPYPIVIKGLLELSYVINKFPSFTHLFSFRINYILAYERENKKSLMFPKRISSLCLFPFSCHGKLLMFGEAFSIMIVIVWGASSHFSIVLFLLKLTRWREKKGP